MKPVSKKSKLGQNNNGAPASEAAARKRPSTRRSTTSKKPSVAKKKKAANTGQVQKTKSAALLEPTDAEIRMRAYFIGERRHRLGLKGDSNSDWLEAKRQLVSEVQPR